MKREVAIFAAFLISACGCQKSGKKLSASMVETDIRAHLPIGSSKTEVAAFLDSRKIAHHWVTWGRTAGGQAVSPDSHIEEGYIPDARTDGWGWNATTASIYVDFNFDNGDSNLANYYVYEIYKGL